MSDRELAKTEKLGTETSEGWYAHRMMNISNRLIFLPIKLDFSQRYENGYKPLRKNGNLVFATIGGGEVEFPDEGPDY